MDNLDLEMRLIQLEMKLYNTLNNVVVNQVTEKYKNASVNRITYSLPVMDNESSNSKSTNSAPKSSSLTREERLRYMKECQKNWGKQVPRGGNRK